MIDVTHLIQKMNYSLTMKKFEKLKDFNQTGMPSCRFIYFKLLELRRTYNFVMHIRRKSKFSQGTQAGEFTFLQVKFYQDDFFFPN